MGGSGNGEAFGAPTYDPLCFPALADLHGDGEYKVGNQKVEWGKLRSEICREGQHTLEPIRTEKAHLVATPLFF